MEIIENIPPPPKGFAIDRSPLNDYRQLASQSNKDYWTDPGPPLLPNKPSPRACPKCDSRAIKTVRRLNKAFMLECPVCGELWPYNKPSWV
jgi:hypothetical protein